MTMKKPTQSYNAYRRTNVQTSDQLSLIIMLYDGCIRFSKKSIAKMDQGDVEGAHIYNGRAKDIVMELLATLKVQDGGEISQNLQNLYNYCFQSLVEANLRKDRTKIEDVIKVLNNLRSGWIAVREERSANKRDQGMQGDQPRKLNVHG